MINLIIRNTTSLSMLIFAIVVYNIYPHNPFNNSLIIALFCWFTALGPLRWMELHFEDVIESKDAWEIKKWLFFFLQFGLLVAGVVNFVKGCSHIS